MKLLPVLLQVLLSAAEASDYNNAFVVSDVLSEKSTAALAGQVGANRLLRSGGDGDSYGSYKGNRWLSEATVSADDLESMLHAIGETRAVIGPTSLRSTVITGDTEPHMDFKADDGEFEEGEKVVLMFLEDNEDAYLQVGEDKIPVTKGTMVAFQGQSVVHKTVVPSGTEVRLLGPFATKDLQGVGDITCNVDVQCAPDVCFNAIEEEECPHGKYLAFEYLFEVLNIHHGCNDYVSLGEICEADGECGSNNQLNNCGFLKFHGYTTILDIYRRVECCPETCDYSPFPSVTPSCVCEDGVCTPCATPADCQSAPDCAGTGIAAACDKPSTSPTGQCYNYYCRRRLRDGEEDPVKEDLPLKEVHEIIDSMRDFGAKRDSTFSFMYDLITKKSCDALIGDVESSLATDLASGRDLPTGTASVDGMEEKHESWLEFADGGFENQYDKKLYADDLVRMIGREETLKIIDFFEESLDGLTIDCMYLARHGDPGDAKYMVPWHMDDYATVEITLNNDYHGGHALHLNGDGVHKTYARPGSTIAHKDDIVHGITPNKGGAKYMLILKHHFNRPDKVGVVRLSRDIVNKINPGSLRHA